MTNPVIIFIVPSNFKTEETAFPIGWTDAGECHAPIQNGVDYCLIALNDGAEAVNELTHGNKTPDAPLVVITHKNSTHHRDPTTSLSAYGRPQLGISFSHTPNDPIFKEIKNCFEPPSKALEFAQKHRNHSLYRTWDQLAAFFQLKLMQNETKRSNYSDSEKETLAEIKMALLPPQRDKLQPYLSKTDWAGGLAHAKEQGEACCPK